ncbi:unnamed protein product [Orchesella dallaii]|uniref:Uncharacterized protein n=1 Tax=Orchesella dallaii TaxID=48710 RepID=A0ABP1RJ86_9HEXA
MGSINPESVTQSFLNFFSNICAFPYQFDWKNVNTSGERLRYLPKGLKFYIWRLNEPFVLWLLYHIATNLNKWFPTYLEKGQVEMLIVHTLWLVGALACKCFQLSIFLKHTEFPKQFNATLDFAWKMERYFRTKEFKKQRRTRNIAFFFYAIQICQFSVFSAAVIAYSKKGSFYCLNAIPERFLWKYGHEIWPTFLVVGSEIAMQTLEWGGMAIVLYMIAVHIQTVNGIMSLIIRNLTCRNTEQMIQIYRKCQLLNINFNSIFQNSFFPTFLLNVSAFAIGSVLSVVKTMGSGYVRIQGLGLVLTVLLFGMLAVVLVVISKFDWENVSTSGERLRYLPKGIKLYVWRLHEPFVLWLLYHIVTNLYKWFPTYLEKGQVEMLILHTLWLVAILACNCFQLSIFLKHKEFPKQFNATLDFAWKMERYFRTKEFKKQRRTRSIAFFCYAVLICQFSVFSAAVIAYSKKGSWYYLNAIPERFLWKYEHQIWPTFLVVGSDVAMETLEWGGMAIVLYTIAVHIQTVNGVMSLIIRKLTCRNSEEMIKIYRKCQLLNINFNSIFQNSFFPTFLLNVSSFAIGSILSVVKTVGSGYVRIQGLGLVLTVMLFGMLAVVLVVISKVHTKSGEVKQALVAKANWRKVRWVKKFPVVGVNVERFGTTEFKKQHRTRSTAFFCYALLICEFSVFSAAVIVYTKKGIWYFLNAIPEHILWKYEYQIWPTVLVVGSDIAMETLEWGGMAIVLYMIAVHIQTVNGTMNLIIRNLTVSNSEEMIRIYRKCQLLNINFNSIFQNSFFPTFLLNVSSFAIGSLLTLVKTVGSGYIRVQGLGLVLTVMVFGMLALVLVVISKVHTKSVQVKIAMVGKARKRNLRRIKYFPVVGVNVGNFFTVKKHTLLLVLDTLSNATATALLSFNF